MQKDQASTYIMITEYQNIHSVEDMNKTVFNENVIDV